MPQATPEMIRDAARWNALVHCGGLSTVGWAGYNPERWKDGIDDGYRYVTINFHTHHGGFQFPERADTHNHVLGLLTGFADTVAKDLDATIPEHQGLIPPVDYEAAFKKLAHALSERRLQLVGKSDPESRAVYHALQYLMVKYIDRGALRGPLFTTIESPNAEP